MFDRRSLHIAMLLWGCIFSLIAALCIFMSKNFDREKRKWMLWMQLASAVLLCSDAFAWGFRGLPGRKAYWIVHISNFLVFLLSDGILLLFHGYLCSYLFEQHKRQKQHINRVKLVYGIITVGMALVVISQFTDFYYYIDAQNLYHRQPAYMISLLIPVCGMVLDLSLLIQYRKNVSIEIFVSMISYITLPFLGTIGLAFYYGISLTNIAISISMILMFVAAMVEQNRRLTRKEQEAADLRISLMLSQIAPHFIYNALTTIQRLCVTDPKLAQETVTEFAGYLRGNLDSLNRKEPVPFEKELEHVKYYLAIEKKRFGERIHVEFDIREEDFMIPALTLQPLVENAVKHGICKKEGGGTVFIRTEKKQNNIYIIIEDDGVGFEVEKVRNDGKDHVGLLNVESRISSMCGGSLAINSTVGKGTMTVLTLPQQKEI